MQRRNFIKSTAFTAFSISAFGAINWNGTRFEGDSPTTTDILGPFYRPNAPMRTNLRVPGTQATPIVLKGVITKEDGRTPVANALVEIWHCDEHQVYDNATDNYNYRGSQKTKADGKYGFKSILPVPYKADPDSEASWRPAHIHMRVSVPGQQDLVTQVYFKGGKYVDTDTWASAPQSANRVLEVRATPSGESEIIFNVVLRKEYALEQKVYDRICGLYDMGKDHTVEFIQQDDALHMKHNGQLSSALSYIGNNTFQEGDRFVKAAFTLNQDGSVEVVIGEDERMWKGKKYLKYS
jgi:protocatechuate 3,4-dioxygenase beta subunit